MTIAGPPAATPAATPATTPDRHAAALAFYGPLTDAPDAARRVGWDNAAAHGLRLSALAEIVVAHGASDVLDVGCGEGALVPVLRRLGFSGRYRGEDVLPQMIARAALRHADDDMVELAVGDALELGTTADVVVCSGALNTVVGPDHDAEVAAWLTTLWSRARAVLAVDLAVADRHAEGVGLARADLQRAWSHARTLAPIVSVREDVVPGEALLVLARSREPAWARWVPDAVQRARLLLDAGEPARAEALVAGVATAEAWLVRGRAAHARGALAEAEASLDKAIALADPDVATAARLELAPVYWRRGHKARAEALLRDLVQQGSDDARAHLAMMLLGRGARAEAVEIVRGIADPWIGRELARHVDDAPSMVKRAGSA